jgi:asparagine synthase (glutamine-hydrolysing)
MSGWVAIVNLDGAAPDAQLAERMTQLTQRHGGDGFGIHSEGEFAFGHSPLASLPESALEQQPLSFDSNTWIVGDVRLDAREELASTLQARGQKARLDRPDIELVLHAINAWGEGCLDHIRGDFAFVSWNRQAKSLFAARDSFGIKPLYYCRNGSSFLFANDIAALRMHPSVSNALHEAAICDFLIFGYNLDQTKTYFSDIHRLPPSHALTIQPDKEPSLIERELPILGRETRYRTEGEYCDHLLGLFELAVSDRLRNRRVGVEMSGGLDSTSVAAMAARAGSQLAGFHGLAVTTDNSSRDPADEEARFAREVSEHLGFGHQLVVARSASDFYAYCGTSQPFASPYMSIALRFSRYISAHGPVMLSGQGGDVVLHGSGFGLLDNFREQSLAAFLRSFIQTASSQRRIRGLGIRSIWAGSKPRIRMRNVPNWVRPEFLAQAATFERFRALYERPGRYPKSCRAELAWDELHMPLWTHLFEDYYHDLFNGIDCRHPWFDVRLVKYLLSIPTSLKKDKYIIRLAMKRLLPASVLERPKSIIKTDRPPVEKLDEVISAAVNESKCQLSQWIDLSLYHSALNRYSERACGDRFSIVAPANLALWINEQLC